MKIEFKKITQQPKTFSLEKEGLRFFGEVLRLDSKLYTIKARLEGNLDLVCDRTGAEYCKNLKEDLVLHISNGIWDTQSQNNNVFDIIEFFDGFIDFEYVLQSEVDSIKMEYHTKEGE